MKQFYVLKAKTRGYIEDIKWLKQEWRLVQAHPVNPFSLGTKTVDCCTLKLPGCMKLWRRMYCKTYSALSLMTMLKTKSGPSFVKSIDIAAGIPRDVIGNAAVIDMGINMIVEGLKGWAALSSLMVWPKSPEQWLSETPFNYWRVIIVEVAFPTTLRVNFYESLPTAISDRNQECVEKQVATILGELTFGEWSKERFSKEIVKKWVNEPAQPHGTAVDSCFGNDLRVRANAHRLSVIVHRGVHACGEIETDAATTVHNKAGQPSEESITEMQKTDEEISKVLTMK
ncbi:hypothetical protein GQ600_1464 [Phytophthora cactorum]|nr:hypothetical protein GQ600_1464 [Phytophthora cactorum]